VRVQVVRLKLERPLVRCNSLGQKALRILDVSQVRVRLGEVRFQSERATLACLRLPALSLQNRTEVGMKSGHIGVDRDRLADH
jgi:hypothetical protein